MPSGTRSKHPMVQDLAGVYVACMVSVSVTIKMPIGGLRESCIPNRPGGGVLDIAITAIQLIGEGTNSIHIGIA